MVQCIAHGLGSIVGVCCGIDVSHQTHLGHDLDQCCTLVGVRGYDQPVLAQQRRLEGCFLQSSRIGILRSFGNGSSGVVIKPHLVFDQNMLGL